MKTFTISADEELHRDFKKLCMERGTNISKTLQEFMRGEVDGKESAFNNLEKRICKLEDAIDPSIEREDAPKQVPTEEKEGF